jgi:hypothetical protein
VLPLLADIPTGRAAGVRSEAVLRAGLVVAEAGPGERARHEREVAERLQAARACPAEVPTGDPDGPCVRHAVAVRPSRACPSGLGARPHGTAVDAGQDAVAECVAFLPGRATCPGCKVAFGLVGSAAGAA